MKMRSEHVTIIWRGLSRRPACRPPRGWPLRSRTMSRPRSHTPPRHRPLPRSCPVESGCRSTDPARQPPRNWRFRQRRAPHRRPSSRRCRRPSVRPGSRSTLRWPGRRSPCSRHRARSTPAARAGRATTRGYSSTRRSTPGGCAVLRRSGPKSTPKRRFRRFRRPN